MPVSDQDYPHGIELFSIKNRKVRLKANLADLGRAAGLFDPPTHGTMRWFCPAETQLRPGHPQAPLSLEAIGGVCGLLEQRPDDPGGGLEEGGA